MKNLQDKELYNKLVLLRVDYNVKLKGTEKVSDVDRIYNTLETIKRLVSAGARVVICSHLGRPKGQIVEELSLKKVYKLFNEQCTHLVGAKNVIFSEFAIGDSVDNLKRNLKPKEILFLENLRFYEGEENCDMQFAKQLCNEMDIFIDEAFAVSHRKCASNVCCASILPTYYGLNTYKEWENLTLDDKEKPICVILGGAKVNDKLDLLLNLLDKIDCLCIGGLSSLAFLKLNGIECASEVEKDAEKSAREILTKANALGVKVLLPLDFTCVECEKLESGYREISLFTQQLACEQISSKHLCYDIGDKTIDAFVEQIEKSATVFWNGPLGYIEDDRFQKGTKLVAEKLAKSKVFSIIGGGDTAQMIRELPFADKINFISTGGGASLNYLQKN